MVPRTYDRFMVHAKIGANRKIRRLTPAQRWCHVAGILALASESPVPGHLLIAEGMPVDVDDLSKHAGVSLSVAQQTLTKAKELGLVRFDHEMNCHYVHDWDEWNTPPKSDPGAAERMRRRRARLREAGLPSEVPEETRRFVYQRDGFKCLACDTTEDLSLDHIVPVSKGGNHDAGNLGTLCGTCNRMKGVRLLFGEDGYVTTANSNGHVRQEVEGEVEEERLEQ